MPLYEYFCPACSQQFEMLRPMSQGDAPAVCPAGHTTNNRVVSLFASFSKGSGEDAADVSRVDAMGGGCACGGACSCGGH